MRHIYINYYFKEIKYDDNYFSGKFSSPDSDVYCDFKYDRITGQCEIWNNSRLIEEILPLPIWWLDKKIEENGKLNVNESKISY